MRVLKRLRISYLHVLIVIWLASIWYGERSYPYRAISKCKWPGARSDTRVALIADPQIIDDNTYPERSKFLLGLTKYITDVYLRKNWVYINQALDPDANVFLGDLLDGGREWTDKPWKQEFERFNTIFTKPPLKRTVMSLPGNHDIGYGDTIVPHALNRFKAYFGEPSSTIDIGNHTLVLLDTISMLNTINSSIYRPPREFMEKLASSVTASDSKAMASNPRILLSHVPLYRNKDVSCGRYRESRKPLPYVKGFQYQTLVTPELSQEILASIDPVAIFSGDDHDACHVKHSYEVKGEKKSTDEFTVKSVSMAMGIDDPGIQLLTLNNGQQQTASSSYETEICFMPSPFYPFLIYGIVMALTVLTLVVYNLYPKKLPQWATQLQKAQNNADLENDNMLPMYNKEESNNSNSPSDSTAKTWKPFRPPQYEKKNVLYDILFVSIFAFTFYIYLSYSIYN